MKDKINRASGCGGQQYQKCLTFVSSKFWCDFEKIFGEIIAENS